MLAACDGSGSQGSIFGRSNDEPLCKRYNSCHRPCELYGNCDAPADTAPPVFGACGLFGNCDAAPAEQQ